MISVDCRYATVDGSEIRRSPAEVGRLTVIPLFTGFEGHPRWLALGFLNHQQYLCTFSATTSWEGG